jgi:hypothetical protein
LDPEVWLGYAVSAILALSVLALPVAAVLVATRERQGRHLGKVSPLVVFVAAVAIALVTITAVSTFSPHWSSTTVFEVAAVPWAVAAWSGVFLWRYQRGSTAVEVTSWGLLAAIAAPFIGAVLLVMGNSTGL